MTALSWGFLLCVNGLTLESYFGNPSIWWGQNLKATKGISEELLSRLVLGRFYASWDFSSWCRINISFVSPAYLKVASDWLSCKISPHVDVLKERRESFLYPDQCYAKSD